MASNRQLSMPGTLTLDPFTRLRVPEAIAARTRQDLTGRISGTGVAREGRLSYPAVTRPARSDYPFLRAHRADPVQAAEAAMSRVAVAVAGPVG